MKKLIYVAFSLLLAVAVAGCSSKGVEQRKVRNVATKYVEALHKGDAETAKKYASKESHPFIDLAISLKGMGEAENPELKDEKFEMKITSDSIGKEKSWVKFADKEGGELTIDLVKRDGKWLVAQSK